MTPFQLNRPTPYRPHGPDPDRERRIEATTSALLADDTFRAALVAMALQVIGELDERPYRAKPSCA